jgi:polyphosphate:AMP phosphotransferase
MDRWTNVLEQSKLGKEAFKAAEPGLRQELVELQQRLRTEKTSVVVVFAGVDGAGKHEMVNTLNAWMDPRGIHTHAYTLEQEADGGRPRFWKYWRDLPANGQVGLFLSAWYSRPLVDWARRKISEDEFQEQLERMDQFERTLSDNGILLVKIWMHLDKKSQLKRLEELASSPKTEWQIKPGSWENWGNYTRFMEASDRIVEASEKAGRPWFLVNGKRKYGRQILAATHLRDTMRERMESPPTSKGLTHAAWNKKLKSKRGSLASLDLTQALEKKDYKKKLKKLQRELYQLQHEAEVKGISTVLVFEGQDAAGKGGAIRRLVQGLDARQYQVTPIAAPIPEELAHHYLWRFWNQLPKSGRVQIFDRSWYGRVLVERVEGFADNAAWQRAFQEIREFESALVNHGMVVCKFWIQIDKDTQLQRFEERENTPYKKWKITDEDWRNREKWDVYDAAVDDMISLTDQEQAPWILVPGTDKYYARIQVLETVCAQVQHALSVLT